MVVVGKDLELHSFELFERQLFEKRSSSRCEIVLDWIGEGEEIAPGALQSVSQANQFFPTVHRDQPAEFQVAFELFRFDPKIHNVRIGPDEWMKRLNLGDCRSILFAAM